MADKRRQNEASLKNLEKGNKFSKDYQPSGKNKSAGKLKASAERKEIEKSAQILERLLSKTIVNNQTGEEITQKEAMLLTLLGKAIKEKDLKAMEMILKIIGDMDSKLLLENKNINITVADAKHKQMLEDL